MPYGDGTSRWEAFIVRNAGKWRAAIKRIFLGLKTGEIVILDRPDPGIISPSPVLRPPSSAAQNASTQVRCPICSEVVSKGISFSRHLVLIHQFRQPERVFVDGSGRCPVCWMQFSSRGGVLAHLVGRKTWGTACSRQLWLSGYPGLPEEELAKLDKLDAERKKKLRSKGRAAKTTDRPAFSAGKSPWIWLHGPIREVRPAPLPV